MGTIVYKKEGIQQSRKKSSPSIFNNAITRVLFLGVSIFLLYNVAHSIDITIQKLNILQRARREVDELRLKNLELALLIEDIQGLEYLEIQARDRLNFAGEKEYVFVIPDATLAQADENLDRLLGNNQEQPQDGGYEVWVDFFLNGI
jgi:cell division protein FtsB